MTAPAHHLTIVEGGNALSPVRAAALLARIRQVAPVVTDLSARYVHVVSAGAPLGEATTDTVQRLLDYGDAYRPPSGEGIGGEVTVVVAPRLGTVSPWASKATDIAHSCGVDIHRVERVTEYHLRLGEGADDADSEDRKSTRLNSSH